MPDLSKRAKDSNGQYWCLDRKTWKFYRINIEEPLVVPQEVIGSLLEAVDTDKKLPEEKETDMERAR